MFHRVIRPTSYESLFRGKPGTGLLKDGVSAEEQLLEVLGDKNKEEENAEEVRATLVECRVTLGRADNKDNADNARLNITFSCDKDECHCQTLEELDANLLGLPPPLNFLSVGIIFTSPDT